MRDHPQRGERLDRLMRRPILAKADGIMRQHIDDMLAHQRRQADCRACIIGKDQKCAAVRNEPAVQGKAVQGRGHAEFADAVMKIAAGEILRRHRFHIGGLGIVRAGQIGRAAKQIALDFRQLIKRLLRGDARRLRRIGFARLAFERVGRFSECRAERAGNVAIEASDVAARVPCSPCFVRGLAAHARAAPG